MAYQKQNLSVDSRIKFKATGGSLDEQTGTVLAKITNAYLTDDYIIAYDVPVNGQKAILITEACLQPI
jgi:hypothetical protein